MALEDAPAEALYEASEAIEIARSAIKEYFEKTMPPNREKELIKLAFKPAHDKLIAFWRSLGAEEAALRMEGKAAAR